MDLKEFFRLQENGGVAAFAEAQVQLFRHDARLQDYFLPVQLNVGRHSSGAPRKRTLATRALNVAFAAAYGLSGSVSRRRYKVDVLYCPTPYHSRATENRLLVRTLVGLAETGASILCLLPENPAIQAEIRARLKEDGHSGQVTLLDPMKAMGPTAARLLTSVARNRGRRAFDEVTQVLEPLGIAPPLDSLPEFEDIARYLEAWTSIEQLVEFDSVVARCHWLGLCSPVCRTALGRGKPVITFQQGVIDHTLDVPVAASKYVAFGSSSAKFLASMNQSFYREVGRAGPSVDFISGGSLFDTLLNLPNQFENRTVLVIVDSDPTGFYGLDVEKRGALQLATSLLRSGTPLRRMIFRLHPFAINTDVEPWKQLVREYPFTCELSSSAWTLEDDLRRASVVVGNTSGALTVAAGSGLPTIFLETVAYATGDLECFQHGQTFPPAEAHDEIGRILADSEAYDGARAIANRNAREYYANGANLNVNGEFFRTMIQGGSRP